VPFAFLKEDKMENTKKIYQEITRELREINDDLDKFLFNVRVEKMGYKQAIKRLEGNHGTYKRIV